VQQNSIMISTLSALLKVYPPSTFALIGAGNGSSALIHFLLAHNMNNGVLVEANADQFHYLKEHIAKSSASQSMSKSVHGNVNNAANKQLSHTLNKQTQGALNWHLIHDVVSVKTDNTYFVTNKTVEDGLIDPQYLSNIWPNIKLKHAENVQAIHLNTVYDALNIQPNWLFIDCLGAELIIDIENDLNTLDVICIRVLLNDSHQLPSNNEQFNALNTALDNACFKNISITPSNHPQIAHAIFVRDYKKQNEFECTKVHSAYEKALSTAEEQSKAQQAQAEQTLANALAQQAQIEQTLQADIAQKDASLAELKAQHEQAMSEAHSAYEKALSDEKADALKLSKVIDSNKSILNNANKLYRTIAHKYAIKKLELQKHALQIYKNSNVPNQQILDLKVESILEMGEAWSSNTVNTVIFRAHAILTKNNIQYSAFYVDQETLRLIKRDLGTQEVHTFDIKGEYNLYDAHNSISLGIDHLDYLHISYDHHATSLQYRRSNSSQSISDWSENMPMSGKFEEKVTYPTFITPTSLSPLMLLYRDGTHNNGTARLKIYSEKSQTWSDLSTPILTGMEQKPWTSNAYWNSPCLDDEGCLHLSYVWRTGVIGTDERVNNINIGYAWSPDLGNSWFTINSQPYIPPITPSISETIWPTGAGSNLINQCSMALDSHRHPHIVFYSNDKNQIPQYQHLWFDGNAWQHQYISKRTVKFNLTGGGTLQLPMSRPEIVIDEHNHVLFVFQSDETNHHMSLLTLQAPGYDYDSKNVHPISPEPVGYAEPIIDKLRWQQEKVLSLLIQYNHQPNHDVGNIETYSPIAIVDVTIQYKS